MDQDSLEADLDSPDSWAPSAELRSALTAGIWATLAAGVILIAESALTLVKEQGLALAITHGLGWLALVPGFWIVGAYAKLGRESAFLGLMKSSICLFVGLILLQIFDLANMEAVAGAGQVVLWVAFVLGLLVLVSLPFALQGAATAGKLQEQDVASIVAGSAVLQVGDRVLGHYRRNGVWYAGSLQSIEGQSFQIAYDDGDTESLAADAVVAENLVAPGNLAVGDRVFARWWGGSCYYLGTVTEARPGQANIRYDDGDTEWCKLDAVRLPGVPLTAPAPRETAELNQPEAPAKKGRTAAILGTLGGLGVVAFAIFKWVFKGAIVARLVARGAPRVLPAGVDWLEVAGAILTGFFFLLLVIYFIWFAVAKIAARSRLGGIALLLGMAELLGFIGMLGLIGWLGVQFAIDCDQPGITDEQVQQLEAQLLANLAPFEIVFTVGWAALNMGLFWNLSSRHDDEEDANFR